MLYVLRLATITFAFIVLCATIVDAAQPPLTAPITGDALPVETVRVESESSEQQKDDLRSKRNEVAEQLRVAQRTLDSAKEAATDEQKSPQPLAREVDLLKQLEVIIAQQQSAAAQQTDLATQLSDLTEQLEVVRQAGPSEEKPYSFLLLDQLRDSLTSLQKRTATVEATVANAEQAVVRAKATSEEKNQERLHSKSALEGIDDDDKRREAANALKIAEFSAKIAVETVELRKQERSNEQVVHKIHQARVDLLQEKVNWIEKDVVFSENDLHSQMLELDKQEADLKREISYAEDALQQAEREWSRAHMQLDESVTRDPKLVETVEAKQVFRRLQQQRVAIMNARLQRLGIDRELWNRRYRVVARDTDTEELITWSKETQATIEQLDRDKVLAERRIDELRQDVANRDKKLQAIDENDTELRRRVADQRDALTEITQVYNNNIVSIEATLSLAGKLQIEIDGDVAQWSWSQWGETAKFYFDSIRNTVLTTVDDHPITVGTVVVGILLLFGGFMLARTISRWLGRRLRHGRMQIHESASSALQSITFYMLLVCFTFTTLRFVNVPLTVFTFFGGAIAIGVGFGSQNIINNFISGLILLAERPIKVGDLIQLDDLFGNVEVIGARSTRIRTGTNLELIVPNSKFLENNVVNLTLGDDRLRTQVNVGVAYGSPTREVARILKHAAEEHGLVMKHPEPFVWFVDFADNSLNFQLHFWVTVRNLSERQRIESDVRFRIDSLFREAGICIAFPQRDVHLHASSPIAVQVLPSDDSNDQGKPGPTSHAA